jgi:UDP-N-acetylglucosamine 2-epimerase (non-hydrolysing)
VRPVVECVVGTRPEAVKMAPLVLRLRREGTVIDTRILATGQHRGLLDQALADFGLRPDADLGLMRPNQGLADLTARALTGLSEHFERARPDLVLAQGDTTTVLATALACHYQRIPFGHVEAGLRTGDPDHPFPEEKNRELADHLAALHFAPTVGARANLEREGIRGAGVQVTGNTVIDALELVVRQEPQLPVRPATARFLLVTAHRRESFGAPLARIVAALGDVLGRHADLSVVFPVHPNPNVREAVGALAGHPRAQLIEPVSYPSFVALMKASLAILTDSGGVQEEAPSLGKPVLVLREVTERPEAVEAGAVRLVGTDRAAIVAAVEALVGSADGGSGARILNPYGDGHASERIARIVAARLGIDLGPWPEGLSRQWLPERTL